jgi:hypothetical protein
MGIKDKITLIAALAGAVSGYSRGRSVSYKPVSIPKAPLKNILNPAEIPKGHSVTPVIFEIEYDYYKFLFKAQVSHGTEKSKAKRTALIKRQIEQYLRRTPIKEVLVQREYIDFTWLRHTNTRK